MGAFTEAIRLPSAKFPAIGSETAGLVVGIEHSDVPDFDNKGHITGSKVGDDGVIVQQVDVIIETEKGRVVLHTGGAIFYAIGRALAEITADDLEVGDSLSVIYTGDGEPTAKGRNAPKQYAAVVSKA